MYQIKPTHKTDVFNIVDENGVIVGCELNSIEANAAIKKLDAVKLKKIKVKKTKKERV